jgi:hypothetical protein
MTKFVVLPVISAREYDAFRRTVGTNLADTYDEWAKLKAEQIAEVVGQGDTFAEVKVKHDEFLQYCRTNGKKPNPRVLLDFANFKKTGGKA